MLVEVGSPVGARRVVYEPAGRRWWLWWPCPECGGAELPLRDGAGADDSTSGRLPLAQDCDQLCPGCVTRRKRRELAGAEPAVWYDTSIYTWVVRLPCCGLREGVLLPLEIRSFDASLAEVYRAAADLAYGGDALEDVPIEARPELERNGEADSSP